MYYKEYRQDKRQTAAAAITGGPFAPQLKGKVVFRDVTGGTWICVRVEGLPQYKPGENEKQPVGPHGFHIHENGSCQVGDPKDPFKAAGGHWNPTKQPHGCVDLLTMKHRSLLSEYTPNL